MTEKNRVTKYIWFFCKNNEVDRAITDVILKWQNDEWSLEVKGLLDFVNNLRAEDAIYHGDCNSRFQSEKTNKLKSLLKLYLGNVGGHHLMRERKGVWGDRQIFMAEWWRTIIVSKLNNMMKEKASGNPHFVFAIYYEGSCLSLFCS